MKDSFPEIAVAGCVWEDACDCRSRRDVAGEEDVALDGERGARSRSADARLPVLVKGKKSICTLTAERGGRCDSKEIGI